MVGLFTTIAPSDHRHCPFHEIAMFLREFLKIKFHEIFYENMSSHSKIYLIISSLL